MKSRNKGLVLLAFTVLFVSGCGTSYNPSTSAVVTPLNSDTFRINTRGNAFTDLSTTQDYALLRASELALQNGYRYFIILSSSNRVKRGTTTTPGSFQSNTYGTAQAYSYGGYGTAYGSSTTYGTYTPPQTSSYEKPRSEIVVKLLHRKPNDINIVVYDAQLIFEQLDARVRRGSGVLGF